MLLEEIDRALAQTDAEVRRRGLEPRGLRDGLRQIVYGVALEPNVPDADGHVFSPEAVAHARASFDSGPRQVWFRHAHRLHHADVVESRIAEQDEVVDDPACGRQIVRAGSWVLGVHVADPEAWKLIAEGQITGLSPRIMADAVAPAVKQSIVQRDGKFCVVATSGKEMGCYPTRPEAERRLAQIEMFKHMKRRSLVEQFNQYHDNLGRFGTRNATGGGASPSGDVATAGGAAVAGETEAQRAERLAYNKAATARWREKKKAEAAAKKEAEAGGAGGGGAAPKAGEDAEAKKQAAEDAARKKALAEWEEKGYFAGDMKTATAEFVLAGSPKRLQALAEQSGILAVGPQAEAYARDIAAKHGRTPEMEELDSHVRTVNDAITRGHEIDSEHAMNALDKINSKLVGDFSDGLVNGDTPRQIIDAFLPHAKTVEVLRDMKPADMFIYAGMGTAGDNRITKAARPALATLQAELKAIEAGTSSKNVGEVLGDFKLHIERETSYAYGRHGTSRPPMMQGISNGKEILPGAALNVLGANRGSGADAYITMLRGQKPSDIIAAGHALSKIDSAANSKQAFKEAEAASKGKFNAAKWWDRATAITDSVTGLSGTPLPYGDRHKISLVAESMASHVAKLTVGGKKSAYTTLADLPAAEVAKHQKLIDSTWDKSAHDSFKATLDGAFHIVHPRAVRDAYEAARKSDDNERGDLFHGTDLRAGQGITTTGFRVSVGAEVKTGSMLGNGVYLADKSSKSIQYIGSEFSRGTKASGVLLLNRASMGKVAEPTPGLVGGGRRMLRAKMPADDVHTVYGKKGGIMSLVNDEWCVRKSAAVLPTVWLAVTKEGV